VRELVGTSHLAQNANLLQNGDFSAPLDGTWTAGGSNAPQVEVVEAEGKKALRVTMQMKTGQNSWDSRVYAARTSEALPRHALVAVRFRARSAQSSRIGVIFQVPDPRVRVVDGGARSGLRAIA
jgi:hypothetical protein